MKHDSTMVGCSLAFALFAAGATVTGTGCAAPAAAEPQGQGRSADSYDDPEAAAAAANAAIDANTLYMNVDGRAISYNNADGNARFVTVCENDADSALVDRIKNLDGQPHLVLLQPDGTYDIRLSEAPRREENAYYCTGGKYGGTAYIFQLWEQDASFLKHLDLSGSFVSGFAGKSVACEGGFQLQQGLGLDVKNFRIVDGAIQQPEITITLDGQSTGQLQGRCVLKASSGPKVFFAGPVPVVYELQVLFGLQVSFSKASTIHASIGTNGGTLTTDDPTFSITPQLELGVTFYGLVGAYVGADFPIDITPHPPCSPQVMLGVKLKAGAQAGLLGIGDLPISKALSVEVSSPVLGPFTLAESQCN